MIPRGDCACGCVWAAHDHYSGATNCALCECRRYRRPPGWLRRRLAARVRGLTGEDDTSTKYPPDMDEFLSRALDEEWEQLEREQRGGTP